MRDRVVNGISQFFSVDRDRITTPLSLFYFRVEDGAGKCVSPALELSVSALELKAVVCVCMRVCVCLSVSSVELKALVCVYLCVCFCVSE